MLVSACIITYNQQDYIEECLGGVINQNTSFRYEILIGDDCSNDKTSQICQEYAAKYPHLIKYRKRQENLGMCGNWRKSILDCNGKYIALCEGDDYWTDSLKLQKQIDFLEANQDYGLCFHNVKIFDQENLKLKVDDLTISLGETTSIIDLAKGNYIHTPSVVLRNNFDIPIWFEKSPLGDWVLYMIALKNQKIKKLDDVMAVYRIHNASIWSTKTQQHRILNTLKGIKLLLKSDDMSSKVKELLLENARTLKEQLPKNKYQKLLFKIKQRLNG